MLNKAIKDQEGGIMAIIITTGRKMMITGKEEGGEEEVDIEEIIKTVKDKKIEIIGIMGEGKTIFLKRETINNLPTKESHLNLSNKLPKEVIEGIEIIIKIKAIGQIMAIVIGVTIEIIIINGETIITEANTTTIETTTIEEATTEIIIITEANTIIEETEIKTMMTVTV